MAAEIKQEQCGRQHEIECIMRSPQYRLLPYVPSTLSRFPQECQLRLIRRYDYFCFYKMPETIQGRPYAIIVLAVLELYMSLGRAFAFLKAYSCTAARVR